MCLKLGSANAPRSGRSQRCLHRARIVNRFLDFLVQKEMIVSNPVAELRVEYHAKSDKAILRALLAPDSDQALESLRQFRPFGSVLGTLCATRSS